MDLDDEELKATRKLNNLNKQKKAEEKILKQKKEIEELNILLDTMKRNVKINYISKLTLERKIKEIKETFCPNCCECGLCDELEKIL